MSTPAITRLSTVRDDVLGKLRTRSAQRDESTAAIVAAIIADVRKRGDLALLEAAQRFDAPSLTSVFPTSEEYGQVNGLTATEREAIDAAADRIATYHTQQLAALFGSGWTGEMGVCQDADILLGWHDERFDRRWHADFGPKYGSEGKVGQRCIPVKRVGVYVPGGNAAYPSSVLMNALPAQAAGVQEFVICSPARKDGTLLPAVLYAISRIGMASADRMEPVKTVKVGGAAAIAAMALGTETIARVDKVVGPGNRFVTEAKRQLWGEVGVDGYAGPSEVGVIVDNAASASFAAADLLTQVEHAPDNAGFLICLSEEMLGAVLAEVERQLTGAPKEATMRAALRDNSYAIVARDLDEALDVMNFIAPEHLTLAVQDPERALNKVQNAGCVLLGEFTPESAGDYCLGPSHTLPTSGAARWQSPVNVMDFLKFQSVSHMTGRSIQPLIPIVEAFGAMEGFPAHANGATIRRPAG